MKKINCVRKIDGEGHLILIEMKKRGITQAELASALGKSEGWMSQVLHGDIVLTVPMLKEIAKILEVNPGSLIQADDETPNRKFEEYVREICKDEIAKNKEEPKNI